MMDEEETMEKTHILMRRTKTTQGKTTTRNPTTRTQAGLEEETKGDTSAKEEQRHEDCKIHQPDSIEQKLEETMTPTATEIAHPIKEQKREKNEENNNTTDRRKKARRKTTMQSKWND